MGVCDAPGNVWQRFSNSRYRAPIPASAIAAVAAGGRAILTFKGINYHGNVWVGGKLVRANTSGAYSYHDVDITAAVTGNATAAAVAVEVVRSYDWGLDCEPGRGLAPNEQASCRGRSKADSLDLGITFVDWAPAPHDANMGLWRGVDLRLVPKAAPVTIRYPQVATRLLGAPSPTGGRTADLEIMVEVQNWDPAMAVSGVLTARIGALAISVQARLEVPAATAVKVALNVTSKHLADADLWWPCILHFHFHFLHLGLHFDHFSKHFSAPCRPTRALLSVQHVIIIF